MYLKLPTYINFKNVAICPGDRLQVETFCALLDREDKIDLQWEGNFTYVPFEPGHFYIMYCGNEATERVTYFQSEQSMFGYLQAVIGTHIGKFFFQEYEVSKTWIPHLTPLVHHHKVEIYNFLSCCLLSAVLLNRQS